MKKILAIVAVLVCIAASAPADGYKYRATLGVGTPAIYWISTGGSNNMSLASNWRGGIVPTSSDVAIFDASIGIGNPNGGTNNARLSIYRNGINVYGGTVNGDAVVYDTASLGGGTVNGNVIMHDSSFNAGTTIKGTSTFLDSSYSGGGGPYKSLRLMNGKWLWPNSEIFLDLSNRVVSGVSGVFSNLSVVAQNGTNGTTGTVGSEINLKGGIGGNSTAAQGARGGGIIGNFGAGGSGVSAVSAGGGSGGGFQLSMGAGGDGVVTASIGPVLAGGIGGGFSMSLGAGGSSSNSSIISTFPIIGGTGGSVSYQTGRGGSGYSNGKTLIVGGSAGSFSINESGGGVGGSVFGFPTASSTNTGGTGGAIDLRAGGGGPSSGGYLCTGGAGGSILLTGNTGGDATSTNRTYAVGGAGSAVTISGGAGRFSSGSGLSNRGGNGGTITIAALGGGTASGATNNVGGNGGDLILGMGVGGTGTQTNGASGSIIFQHRPLGNPATRVELARMTTNTFTLGLKIVLTNNYAWEDMLCPATLFNSGAVEVSYNDTLGGLQFTTSATTNVAQDHATFNYQLAHRYKAGTDLHPHVHFWQTNADQTNMWYATYSGPNQLGSTNMPDVFVGPASNAIPYTSGTMMQIADLPDISGIGNTNVSSNFRIKLYRRGASGTGNVTATDLDMHYQVDGFGSDSEYSKSY